MDDGTAIERLCPRCQSPLTPLARGAIALDACAECGGVWFDAHELEQLRRQHRGALAFVDKALKPRRVDLSSAPTPLCPVCRIPLVSFAFPNAPRVTVDGCRKCRGLWTDCGELTQFQAALGRGTAAPQATGGSPCPNCGATNYPTDPVCLTCGAQLGRPQPSPPSAASQQVQAPAASSAAPSTVACPRCGKENLQDAVSCARCGTNVAWGWRLRGALLGTAAGLVGIAVAIPLDSTFPGRAAMPLSGPFLAVRLVHCALGIAAAAFLAGMGGSRRDGVWAAVACAFVALFCVSGPSPDHVHTPGYRPSQGWWWLERLFFRLFPASSEPSGFESTVISMIRVVLFGVILVGIVILALAAGTRSGYYSVTYGDYRQRKMDMMNRLFGPVVSHYKGPACLAAVFGILVAWLDQSRAIVPVFTVLAGIACGALMRDFPGRLRGPFYCGTVPSLDKRLDGMPRWKAKLIIGAVFGPIFLLVAFLIAWLTRD